MRPIKKIYYSSRFLRALKNLPVELKPAVVEREQIFRKDSFDPKLKTHKLSGKHKEHWSFSISYGYRILFRFLADDNVAFENVGDHSIY
ncbi:MAG: type II toxin-antitoxin system mRNA interferase toxin, RelE/StbE family [Patescibacteria group bacterium]